MNTRQKRNITGAKRKRVREDGDLQDGISTDRTREVEEVEDTSTTAEYTLTRIKFNRVVNFAFSPQPGNASVFLQLLEEAWKAMSVREVEELIDEYLEVKSILLKKLDHKEAQEKPSLALQLAEMQGYGKLPVFSGDFEDWIGFRDAFLLEVGSSKILEPKLKLRRLMGCLDGRARRVIGNWEYKNENYEKAWQTLVNEFENQDMAINGYLAEFYDLNKCEEQDPEALKYLMDVAKGKQRDILSMKNMSDGRLADIIWRKEIEKRLDDETRAAWLMSTKTGEIATCEELYSFMAKRAKAIEASIPGSSRNDSPWELDISSAQEAELSNPGSSRGELAETSERACLYCSETGHSLAFCKEFSRLSVQHRIKEAYKLGCCYACLEIGHNVRVCLERACSQCPNIKHHSLLCRKKSKY